MRRRILAFFLLLSSANSFDLMIDCSIIPEVQLCIARVQWYWEYVV